MREGVLSCVTDKWQETNREPVPWLMFVMSLGAGAAAAILEIQLCTSPDADNRLNPHASFVVSRQCHCVARSASNEWPRRAPKVNSRPTHRTTAGRHIISGQARAWAIIICYLCHSL